MDFRVLHINIFGDCQMCYFCQYIEIVLGICSIITGTRHIIKLLPTRVLDKEINKYFV